MADELITLIPAGPEDVAGIVDLCLSVERQHEAYWPLRWQLRGDLGPRYHRWLESNLAAPRWLILCAKAGTSAAAAPSLVGVLVAAIQEEIPIYSYREYAFIHDMAVVVEYRRRGVANQLLQEARRWAGEKGVNQIRAMVAVKNDAASKLFGHAGYRATYQEMVQSIGDLGEAALTFSFLSHRRGSGGRAVPGGNGRGF
ncbi:MAG: GNAT family N-acetyltransferase [Phycisphaerae bacterium]|nr:GNAT family N-acetyltransferase [Phycisphaerae bacterium]